VVEVAAPKSAENESVGEPGSRRAARAGFWEWLTRRRALREARQAHFDATPEERALTERAREVALVADRLFDAVEPVSVATGQALAAELYRQALVWSLAARAPAELRGSSPAALWDASEGRDSFALPHDLSQRNALIDTVKWGDFRAFAIQPPGERQRLAAQLRTLVHSAIELNAPQDRTVRALLFQRFVRLFAFVLLVAGAIAVAVVVAEYVGKKPNLAAGKPWRASSTWAVCRPEIKTCGRLRSKIFFHTREEQQPWIEFDLQGPTAFSGLYIKNRTDSMPDRVVPLVVEVSDDAKAWRTVIRREEPFRTWTASFPTVTARYVRLRIDRRSTLHLEMVEIHP
jgi:hypothetical protein